MYLWALESSRSSLHHLSVSRCLWDNGVKGLEAEWHPSLKKRKQHPPLSCPAKISPPELTVGLHGVAGWLAGGIRRVASDLHHGLSSQSGDAPSSPFLSAPCRLFSSALQNPSGGEQRERFSFICKVTLRRCNQPENMQTEGIMGKLPETLRKKMKTWLLLPSVYINRIIT